MWLFSLYLEKKNHPLGWPSSLGLGLPCWTSKVWNPLAAKAMGLPSGSSSSRRACLVQVTPLMWFASYCIETEILSSAHPRVAAAGFSCHKKKSISWFFQAGLRRRYITFGIFIVFPLLFILEIGCSFTLDINYNVNSIMWL